MKRELPSRGSLILYFQVELELRRSDRLFNTPLTRRFDSEIEFFCEIKARIR